MRKRSDRGALSWAAGCVLLAGLSACVQQAPPELLQAVEAMDRQLVEIQGAEFAPEEYARFVEHWSVVRGRLLSEQDVIRWPWETNQLVEDLRKVQAQGERAVSAAAQRKDVERRTADARLTSLEERLHLFTTNVEGMGGRVVLGQQPVETELLAKQARAFFEQGSFSRSAQAAQKASVLMDEQIERLSRELGHYADERRVGAWRRMVHRTVEWSRTHHAAAIVVSKADRRLTLYQNGQPVVSYPVELGFNGILEKRYQGDGATPEGQYRVVRKRDRGQTRFHRAFLLDYPNYEDRRRFQKARVAGALPVSSRIGGEIEIHGGDDRTLSQTLGCIMLDNHQIDRLFDVISEGTPVTIVGAVNVSNAVALALAGLGRADGG